MTLIIHVFPPTPNPYINPLFPFIFISTFTLPVFETPFFSQLCSPSSPTMAKTRGAHSFRPQVCQSPTPPADTSTPGAAATVGPSVAAVHPPAAAAGLSVAAVHPLPPTPPLPQLPSRALPLLMLRAPPLWPLPRGDIIPGLASLRLLHRIPAQPGGPHHLRGPGLQAQGSHPLRDPGRHPHHLIRELLEPRPIPCIHYQAALLPLQPYPGEC